MQDNVMPTGKWEFNQEVTNCFDEMLSRSIPAYADMRALTERLGSKFVQRKTAIVDLGCSTGEAIKPFVSKYGAQNQYKLFDVSEPMLEECKKTTSWSLLCSRSRSMSRSPLRKVMFRDSRFQQFPLYQI